MNKGTDFLNKGTDFLFKGTHFLFNINKLFINNIDIEYEIIKSGKKLPRGRTIVVPTKRVLDYLQLDIDYITEMAEKEKILNLRTK